MYFALPTRVPLLLAGLLLATRSHAADCYPYGTDASFCVAAGATRDGMYSARAAVCGGSAWQSAGRYNIPNTSGYLTWSGVDTQQTCWDAYQNIIDQCSLGANGYHTHEGIYDYNGVRFFALDCDTDA